ncbi:N-acetylmuramate alpha-1-phosphate uridylyltransferase MurU [Polynucleobacter sp. MWH-Spelu-300-X4]|uniref:N-acetylmuramate alpha-1-phosphate uridylyltransferase MurU n=1 Tax=Polynucleobacter sp. MWH-Spelu-300-X4 TaxID=2689109 RepID=UPI001BFD7714|nr:nucleotidyltransferase family protein [Polynucleobacter sp. MWH-Spelu-300-X4]
MSPITIPCMVLAAGRGERMRPLTDHTPKPLLEVQGKALLDWHLGNLQEYGGSNIVINHAWLGEKIVAHIANANFPKLHISFSKEAAALETAGGIRQALDLLNPQDYFFVINGDIFCPEFPFGKISEIVEALRSTKKTVLAYLFLVKNPGHNTKGDFTLEGEFVQDKKELCENYTFSGAGIYHKDLFKGIAQGDVAKLAPLLRNAMSNNEVMGELLKADWVDVGTPERLAELNKMSS